MILNYYITWYLHANTMNDRNAYHVNAVKNANPQSHEWLGEINHLLAFSSNGEASHGQVCFLEGRESPSEGRPHGIGHQDGDRGHHCWGLLPWLASLPWE